MKIATTILTNVDGVRMSLLVIIFNLFLLSMLLALKVLKVRMIEPPIIFLLPWMMSASLLLVGFVEYAHVFSIKSFTLSLFVIGAFVFGTQLCRATHQNLPPPSFSKFMKSYARTNYFLLIFGAGLYVLLQSVDILELIKIKGFAHLLDIQMLRKEHWENYWEGNKSTGEVIKSIVRPFAVIIIISLPIFVRVKSKALITISLVSAMVLFLETLLSGGRGRIVLLLLAAAYLHILMGPVKKTLVLGKKSLLKKRRFGQFVIVAPFFIWFIYMLFVSFPIARNENLVNNVDYYLNLQHSAKIADWIIDYQGVMSWLPIFAYSSSYISLPLAKLTFFMEEGNVQDWNQYGLYNFRILSSVATIFCEENHWLMIREKIADLSSSYGYTPNPWATGIRDFLIDFGIIGTVVMTFLFGYFSQYVYWIYLRRKTPENAILVALISVGVFMFAFISPAIISTISNSVLLIILMIFIRRVIPSLGALLRKT